MGALARTIPHADIVIPFPFTKKKKNSHSVYLHNQDRQISNCIFPILIIMQVLILKYCDFILIVPEIGLPVGELGCVLLCLLSGRVGGGGH